MNLDKLYLDLKKIEVAEKDKEKMGEILNKIKLEIVTNGKINTGIIKEFKKLKKQTEQKPIFQNILEENGNYYLSNGYFLISFKKDKENIPVELRENIQKKDFNFAKYMELDKYTRNYIISINKMKKVLNHNNIIRKETKGENQRDICYIVTSNYDDNVHFNDKNIFLNPELIMQAITLSGNKDILKKELFNCFATENYYDGILFQFENSNIIVFPINVNTKEQKKTEIKKYNDLINKKEV